jgi:hypothetical protein
MAMSNAIFPAIKRIVATTIGFDLVAVKPLSAPIGKLFYTDVMQKAIDWFFDKLIDTVLPRPESANRFDPVLADAISLAELCLLPWPVIVHDKDGAFAAFDNGRWIEWKFSGWALVAVSNHQGYEAHNDPDCYDGIKATMNGERVNPKYKYGQDTLNELIPDLQIHVRHREPGQLHEFLV